MFITEVSSPLLHLRELLKEVGYKGTDLNLAADVSPDSNCHVFLIKSSQVELSGLTITFVGGFCSNIFIGKNDRWALPYLCYTYCT